MSWIDQTWKGIHLDFHTPEFLDDAVKRFDPDRWMDTFLRSGAVEGTRIETDTAVLFTDGLSPQPRAADSICRELHLQHDIVAIFPVDDPNSGPWFLRQINIVRGRETIPIGFGLPLNIGAPVRMVDPFWPSSACSVYRCPE